MNLRRLLAISRKEVFQVLRDSRSLLTVLLMPLMLMSTLGYGVNLDTKHIRVFAYDREGSQASQDLLKRFQSSDYFDLVDTVTDYRALGAALDDGRCQLAIVIPYDFSARLHDGRPVYIQALVDGSDNNTAELAIGYAQGVLASYGAVVQAEYLRKSNAPSVNPVLSVDARTWFNEDLESKNFIVPGVAAIVMAVVGVLLTSLTVAREWERGTMEQLISTPVTALEIIIGKLLPYFALGDSSLVVSGPVSRFGRRAGGRLGDLPCRDSRAWILDLGRHQESAGSEPDWPGDRVPSVVPAFGIHFPNQPDAARRAALHLLDRGALLHRHTQKRIPARHGPQLPRRTFDCARNLCVDHGVPGETLIPQIAGMRD
jgi:ABC-type transport system involved in multi-copper enzyme maturation permease subunit